MSKSIQRVFSEVPQTYELVNHTLTWSLDILWRKKAAQIAALEGGTRWMDVCSGTGEMAAYLGRLAGQNTTVVAADFCIPMLRQATTKPGANQVAFVLADAKSLPFPDGAFDLITISFATRNLNVSRSSLIRSFAEFHRILRPGGRFVSVETSQPPSGLIKKLFHLYVRLTVKPVGYIISRSRVAYAYLSNTIPRFYTADDLADILREAGFAQVDFQRMTLGVAAIHKAVK